jgi:two-component system sensor histidine kinase TctE
MTPARLPSLGARLARHVLVPLAVVWLAGSAFAVVLASYLTEASFDRSLLDDAFGLAATVSARDGGLRMALSADELKAVLYDQSETVRFAVRTPDGALVAGEPDLPASRNRPERLFEFADVVFRGEAMRAVTLRRDQPAVFDLVLAETTGNRTSLLQLLLVYSVMPQAALLFLLGWWLRRTIETDLQPIVALHDELNRRSASDLQPLHVSATTRDVDSLRRSIDALIGRLSTALHAQREFSGNLAHELRTPLAGIRALAEYGLARDDPALWREQLHDIVRSQDRASHLLDQLLALALADEAGVSPARHPVALDQLVRQVLLQTIARADDAGVDLGAEGLDEPVIVWGDEALIEGALRNLLDNALRYGQPVDDTPARVTVDLTREAGHSWLSVTDNGPGIAAPDRQRLLERWQQGREGQRLGEGAGLGLHIVSRYAHLLGAELSIESGPDGRGACVRLRLQEPPAAASA